MLKSKAAYKNLEQASIVGIKIILRELQAENTQAKEIRLVLKKNWENLNGILYYRGFLYVFELI